MLFIKITYFINNKMKNKSFVWWIIFIFLSIWQLPQVLIALIMIPFLGKLQLIKQNKFTFCYKAQKMCGGISLGSFAFLEPRLAHIPEIVSHEAEGHIIDSYILGPLYLFVIGIPSFLHATFGFTKNYYDFYTEKLANYHAGLETDKNGNLFFIKKNN